ncbi:uncharacterized protein METZ01_LOCUS234673 [marine metagenome]|uniref:Helix-turn-helix domain-containing protein n=1 Tax=marine metagenome TaxID=408172 RepID=A0A382H3Q5_9ZZZZ
MHMTEFGILESISRLEKILERNQSNSWLSLTSATKYTGLSKSTLRRAVSKGELRVSRSTGKLLFQTKWIDKWLVG